MRPLLLDTCAVLRFANGEIGKFSRSAMKAMREADMLYVSPISEWEISLKWKQGGIDLPVEPRMLMHEMVSAYSLALIPLSEEVMFKATELPEIHRDPADRPMAILYNAEARDLLPVSRTAGWVECMIYGIIPVTFFSAVCRQVEKVEMEVKPWHLQ